MITVGAHGQFAAGLQVTPTNFQDPNGLFSLTVPSGWTYQAEQSASDFYVFYGPGEYDLLYVEILEPSLSATTPLEQAKEAAARYAEPGGLTNFQLTSAPAPGRLAGKEASFMVYTYSDSSGARIAEGRAFVVHHDKVFSLAFADAYDRFDLSVPTFNRVMESLQLHAVGSQTPKPGIGFGVFRSESQPDIESEASVQTTPTAVAPSGYTSPDGHFRFTPPTSWELWEEQSTSLGDTIEPWNSLFNWPGKPMSKSLFIWDFFDEWEQEGAQYEIVMAVIGNVPGTQNQAIESFKNQVTGSLSHIYTPTTARVRVGGQPAVAVKIAPRAGMVEPWSEGPAWYKSFTFYTFKLGSALFVWALPDEMLDTQEVKAALESFEWTGR